MEVWRRVYLNNPNLHHRFLVVGLREVLILKTPPAESPVVSQENQKAFCSLEIEGPPAEAWWCPSSKTLIRHNQLF